MAGKLVLCRHGQSDWNLKNLFTGWKDVDLTDQGIGEAKAAGRLLSDLGYEFDIAYTSIPYLRTDRSRLLMPEADRIVAEALIRDVFNPVNEQPDVAKFRCVRF